MTVTVSRQPSDTDPYAWALRPMAYTNYNVASPTGVTGSAANGPTDGMWSPALSGAPAASSEILAVTAGTISGYGDVYVSAGSGWSELFSSNSSSVYVMQAQTITGSTAARVSWADMASPASDDSYLNSGRFVALEIKASP